MRLLYLIIALLPLACGGKDSAGGEVDGDVARRAEATGLLDLGRRSSDSAVRGAADALAHGSPWIATTRIAPALATPERRTPIALLVAATAAAGWQGWSEVERLLGAQPWLDTVAAGEGRELLARAALARGSDTAAVIQADRAVNTAGSRESKATRTVLLARAYDRTRRDDAAAKAYLEAAGSLPQAADWLRLRAAGVTRDEGTRKRLYREVRSPTARSRIGWTEAQALERAGAREDAARAYVALGDRVSGLRLRLGGEAGDAERAARKAELYALLAAPGTSSADLRRALDLTDQHFATRTPAEALVVARAATRAGDGLRAIANFAKAEPMLAPRDRFDYGLALVKAGRTADARAQLARVTGPLAGQAAYHRARAAMQGGDAALARRELQDVATRWADDADAATLSLALLGDLQVDDGRDADARATLRQLVGRYPTNPRAAAAAFDAAVIALVHGDAAAAATELDAASAQQPRATDALATLYWSGRAHQALRHADVARARWRAIIDREPLSYYALLSRLALGEPTWAPADDRSPSAKDDSVARAKARLDALDDLGLDAEARLEADALVRDARDKRSTEGTLRAAAVALRESGRPGASIALGEALVARGARDAEAYRLIFPVVHGDRLAAESRANELDPALVAALVRQESSFNPRARSPVGARGLMQIMPDVGNQLARSRRIAPWETAMLYDPDASLTLGTVHLAGFLKQYDDQTRALAAYNAGPARVKRWSATRPAPDPELWAERIPYTETRDYVRTVRRNAAVYRALYGW